MLTCLRYICQHTHTHNDQDAHAGRTTTLHTRPLAARHVPLISVTLAVRSVSILLTFAPQQREYSVYPDTYSLAHHFHLSDKCTHTQTGLPA